MSKVKKMFIYFVIANVNIICYFTQAEDAYMISTKSSGDNTSQLDSNEVPSAMPTAVIDTIFNPCFSAVYDFEQSVNEVSENFTTRQQKQRYSFPETNEQSARNLSSEHLKDTAQRFSDHFLNCSRIGMEPGTFDFLANGSLHIPRLSMVLDKLDFCQSETTGVVFICDERIGDDITDAESNKTKPNLYDYLSDEFLNCKGHVAIENGSFELRPHRSVYVKLYDRVFDYSNYLIREDGKLYLCPAFFPTEKKFEESFEIITIVGLSISIVFIAAYMFSFVLQTSLRNLPGYCLFSLCLALQAAYICFLVRRVKPSHQQCENLVLSITYFFLAAFFWMNVLSFDVWRSLKMATSKLRLSSESVIWKRFALYSAYAWLFPLCIVIFGIIVTKYGKSIEFLKFEFNSELCWFAKKGALLVYLALPLIILMCLNVFFFSTSFVMITRASMNTTDNMATFWKRFFLFLRLAVIMGVSWIFGIIATATNQHVLFYIFVIFNTLQGVFIFFSFALNEKTKKEWKKKIKGKRSACRSQITSQPMQSMTSV